jgi:hypothetical protein
MMSFASTAGKNPPWDEVEQDALNGIEVESGIPPLPLTFPRRPPTTNHDDGHSPFLYFQREHVGTRAIRMDGDVAHGDSEDTDENIISTTILVHSPTTMSSSYKDSSCDSAPNRRVVTLVSPPPGFCPIKFRMPSGCMYDCIIRERHTPRWQQPFAWGSVQASMKRSLMQDIDEHGNGDSSWMMMGLSQYPTDALRSGCASPRLEFWCVQGTSEIIPTCVPDIISLNGPQMIRKVRSIVAASNIQAGGEPQTCKEIQFWVHLIDADVFVKQEPDQVVNAIEKILEAYGRFCPQGVDINSANSIAPVAGTAHAASGNDENPSSGDLSAWPSENYLFDVVMSYDDDVSEDFTVSLQDDADNCMPRRRRRRRRRQGTPLGRMPRRPFPAGGAGSSSDTGDHPRIGRFWSAFTRVARRPARERNELLIDV